MPVTPLVRMKLRTAQLPNAFGASFGHVRNWSAAHHRFTKFHQGWDLEAPIGTPCRAIAAGIISYIGNHRQFGWQVILQFSKSGRELQSTQPGDTYFAHYAHLSAILVRRGDVVVAGQTIALTGASGNASAKAPHLHFEIRNTSTPSPGLGGVGRIDPGEILGYQYLVSS